MKIIKYLTKLLYPFIIMDVICHKVYNTYKILELNHDTIKSHIDKVDADHKKVVTEYKQIITEYTQEITELKHQIQKLEKKLAKKRRWLFY